MAVEIVKAYAGFRSDLDLPLGRALSARGDAGAADRLEVAVRQLREIEQSDWTAGDEADIRTGFGVRVVYGDGLTLWYDPKTMRSIPSDALTAEEETEVDGPSLDLLSPKEKERLAVDAAATVNHALARLFLRLGPPPTGANGEHTTVPSGGGGAVQ